MLQAGCRRHVTDITEFAGSSMEKSGDCLNCYRSAVRNWVRRQDSKKLEDSTDPVLLRFSLVWTNQP
jgi:hypothetical protein